MEAAAENGKQVLILDRPNPNGMYIDGPVLELKHRSFVGMHPIPIVHGLTVGELAQMINEEGWLKEGVKCQLKIVPMKHWNHRTTYSLPVKPSPNLPNDRAIALYPSLCLFEGTTVSVGRGTDHQFQVIGHPDLTGFDHSFTPISKPGAKYPLHKEMQCHGKNFLQEPVDHVFTLSHLIEFYKALKDKPYFNAFFTKLAGTEKLKEQIIAGLSEKEIKKSWEKELKNYKKLRKKYLLYPDFE